LELDVETAWKAFLEPTHHLTGAFLSSLMNELGDLTLDAGGQDDKPFAMDFEELFVDAGLVVETLKLGFAC